MKKIGLIAAAGMLAAAGTAFGQGSVNLELVQITGAAADSSNIYSTDSVTWDGNGTFSITLMVRAQIVGDAAATGLTTFDGTLSDDGSGAFAAALLTNFDAIGFPGIPGNDFQGRAGVTPDYRATIGADNLNPGNGLITPAGLTFLPLAISQTGVAGAVTGLDDIYRVTWTTSDPTARTVVLNVDAAGAGYQTATGLRQTTDIDGGSFTITIVPAPGAVALMGLGGLVAIRRRR